MLQVSPATPIPTSSRNPSGGSQLGVVLSASDAWQIIRQIELQVAACVPHYDQLGDDCDFLTLALDWPYRYVIERAEGHARGIYAFDDLIGRRLDEQNPARLDLARSRWAYAGRLLGDPASSVARAMAALFLQPKSALLWNTYNGGIPWSDYDMSRAAGRLRRDLLGTDAVEHRAGRGADLASWHRIFNPANRFGLVLVNSSGGPQHFAIEGGPGRPADLPRGGPVAVSMIHSFSAADPADPQTIAGRWLAQGAYIFYGSVNEPFLPAFRQPTLVANLLAAGVPLVAALRQGESEAFGFPWRLIYLGDPLYRVDGCRMKTTNESAHAAQRASAEEWRKVAPEYADWHVVEITPPTHAMQEPSSDGDTDTDSARLSWCLDAAIAESAADRRASAPKPETWRLDQPGAQLPLDWRSSLRSIRRERLEPKLRPIFDELLIDALGEFGTDDELQARLSRVPNNEKTSRIWLAIETCATARLARLDLDPDRARSFRRALDLWNEVIQLSWPKGSSFPGQFTERITAVASADSSKRMRPWLVRLRMAVQEMNGRRNEFPHVEAVAAERARVEEKFGHHGLRW